MPGRHHERDEFGGTYGCESASAVVPSDATQRLS